LTWRPEVTVGQVRVGPVAVSEALRAVGYPAPATELVAQVGDAVVWVQELLPGRPVATVDERMLDQLLALNELHAGRLVDRRDVPSAELFLLRDGPGFCLHEPLRRYSARSAALQRWVASVGADSPVCAVGDDAVHMDWHPGGNVLAAGGVVTGVVDWDGAARGDRRLDVVTLRFGVHRGGASRAVVARLDAVLDGFPSSVLRWAWAHMSVRMVDWAIRHFDAVDVESWLDLAERRVS
jgi:aminoglycoside phosphotransferase (APT) family kinase protein